MPEIQCVTASASKTMPARVCAWLIAIALAMPLCLRADTEAEARTESVAAAPDRSELILWYRNYDSPPVLALVRLALEKTPEYGPARVLRSREMGQARALRELASGNGERIHLANVATSPDRENFLQAIPIPIDNGLLGLRVCVVRAGDQDLFEEVYSLADLRAKAIRIGQGSHWPDTGVLEASGLTVITDARFETLFRMLRNDRFDCFARGANEVMFDLQLAGKSSLAIEPDVILAYPMPSYFFVNPQDFATGQRIQLGIERAIVDGSFGDYLDRYYFRPLQALKLQQRRVIELPNPNLEGESRFIGQRALDDLRRRIETHQHAGRD